MRYKLLTRTTASAVVAVLAMLAASCGGTEPQDRTFDLEIVERGIDLDPTTLNVNQDDTVTIMVTTDEHVSFHLHGYDIEKEAKPEQPATLEFTANATGSFPFTIHVVVESQEEEGKHEDEHKDDGHDDDDKDHEEEDIELGRLEVKPR